jgi:hypothetical protein
MMHSPRFSWRLVVSLIAVGPVALAVWGAVRAAPAGQAGTDVCTVLGGGKIPPGTVWGREGSPYLVTCNAQVDPGSSLAIQPGSVVQFSESGQLQVAGTLAISGTQPSDVVFTSSKEPPRAGDWKGITLEPEAIASLKGFTVRYGGQNRTAALRVQAPNTVLESFVIEDTDSDATALVVDRATEVTLRAGSFRRNGPSIDVRPAPENVIVVHLLGSTFEDNAGAVALSGANAQLRIQGNTARRNGVNGIVLTGGTTSSPIVWHGGDLPYVIDGSVTINSDLTIEPGTVVKLRDARALTVRGGRITASGTAEGKITFTAVADDTACSSTQVDCDTTNDGTATTPLPGSWARIELQATSLGATFSHTELRYGSDDMLKIAAPGVSLTECDLSQSSGDATTINGVTAVVTGNRYAQNRLTAVAVTTQRPISVTLQGNTFDRNGIAVRVDPNVTLVTGGNQTPGHTNGLNGYQVQAGGMTAANTWRRGDLPFVLSGDVNLRETAAVLTLEPGLLVKLDDGATIFVERGQLVAGAEGADPVLVTSLRDDACSVTQEGGCDTNGDRSATIPSPGDWDTLTIAKDSAGAFMRRTVVRYGGTTSGLAQVDLRHPNSTIEDNELAYGSGSGLRVAQINQTRLARNYIHHNRKHGIELAGLTTPMTVILDGNRIEHNELAAIDMDAMVELELTSTNTAENNGYNGIAIHGNAQVSRRWKAGNLPYLITGNVNVEGSSTLTIDPGVVIKLGNNVDFTTTRGQLVAEGTSAQPITFTSIRDDSISGDSNPRDGNVTPNAGDWGGFVFDATGNGGRLRQAVIRYGGAASRPGVRIRKAGVLVQDVSIRDAGGPGVQIENVSAQVVHNALERLNGDGIVLETNTPVEPVLQENTIVAAQAAISMDANVQPEFDRAKPNVARECRINGIKVTGTVNVQRTWRSGDLPYVLDRTVLISTGTLLVEEGTLIKGNLDALVQLDRGAFELPIAVADLAGDVPVTMTSWRDDTCGAAASPGQVCDTNGDGDASSPRPGDWKGISIGTAARSAKFAHLRLSYAGSGTTGAAISSKRNGTVVERSQILYAGNDGIRVESSTATIRDNLIAHCVNVGLSLVGTAGVTAENNLFTGNSRPMSQRATGATVTRNNVAVGNVSDAMLYCADVQTDQIWYNDLAREVDCPVEVQNGAVLNLEPGLALLMGDGSSLKITSKALQADGVVFTTTEADPKAGFWSGITFDETASGFLRNSLVLFGGTSTTTGAVSVRAKGATPITLLFNLVLRATETGMALSNGTRPVISGNLFRQIQGRASAGIRVAGESGGTIDTNRIAEAGTGVEVTTRSTPKISANSFTETPTGGVANRDRATCVEAKRNWWGAASGPRDEEADPRDPCGALENLDGKGVPVSEGVEYREWLILAPPAAPVIDIPRCGFTNQTTVRILGTTSADATVNLYDRRLTPTDGPVKTALADSGGRFETTLPLARGEHRLSFNAQNDQGAQSATTGFRVITVDDTWLIDPSGITFEYGPAGSLRQQPLADVVGCATACGGPSSGRVTLPPGERVVVHVPVSGTPAGVQLLQAGRPAVPLSRRSGNVWASQPFEPQEGSVTIEVNGTPSTQCLGYIYLGEGGVVFADIGVPGEPLASFTFENGDEGWTGESPWQRSQQHPHSGQWSWTDSPGGNYPPNTDASLFSPGPFDLRGVPSPQLTFWTDYRLGRGDVAYVEARTSEDPTWVKLREYRQLSGGWRGELVPLDGFARQPRVFFRFRLKTDQTGEDDGWTIDDVTIGPGGQLNGRYDEGEAPVADALVTLWQRNADTGAWLSWDGRPTGQSNPQTTDAHGRYGFYSLSSGEYRLEVVSQRYGVYVSPVQIVWNGQMALQVAMAGGTPVYLPMTIKNFTVPR